MANAAIVDLK